MYKAKTVVRISVIWGFTS